MNVSLNHIISDLSALYSPAEARELALWIMEESTGLSRTQILTECKDTKNIPNYKVILQRIYKKEPIQYIFQHTEWCGLDLRVTPATLIPRPDTAELIMLSKGERTMNEQSAKRILDIGTGSGCIAIALKKQHPKWDVSAMDISAEALAIAQENAVRNDVKINFFQGDIFTDEIGHFDLIVSNPPYVRECEKSAMEANVLDYEPHTALFVPDSDPLCFYRRIARLHAAPELIFEINQYLGSDMIALMHAEGYPCTQLIQDSYGNDRILIARTED